MKKPEDDDVSLFRFKVIAPLLSLEREPKGEQARMIEKLADREWVHPVQGTTRLSASTIERWLQDYRRGGLEALQVQRRSDRGVSRRIGDVVAERIEELASAESPLDGPGILKELRADTNLPQPPPSLSTLYRFLRARGIKRPPFRTPPDHRAFEFDLAGDCWQSDVMYGPNVPTPAGTRRRTYLIAILDDATRLIAHAQFYLDETFSSLKDALKQAFLKRGLPKRLYTDQGRIFRSGPLLRLSARLGIHLIHTRPYQPQGRGKLERFFGTIRRSFLARVDLARIGSIDELNRLLFAFVEGEYHVQPHRGIGGERPLDRWVARSGGIRPLPPDVDIDLVFLDETVRRVRKDGTIVLDGKAFEPGPLWIGQRVTVRFDPHDLRRIRVFSERGEEIVAYPLDLSANRRVARLPDREPARTHPELRSLERRAEEVAREERGSHDV